MIDYENIGDDERQEIPLGSDYVIRRKEMKRWDKNAQTFVVIQTGTAVGWISATRGGAVLGGLTTSLDFPADGAPEGEFQGEDVTAALGTFVNRIVWDNVRVSSGGNSDYLDSKEILVVPTATPGRG